MCIATLQAIIRACDPAASGLSALSVIDPNDLAVQPVWFRKPNIDSLTFKSGKSAYTFEADRLTARLTDKTVITDRAGDRIDYLLQARVSGIRPDIELFRAKTLNRRVHVAATYQSGDQRLLPWMRLIADADSGDRSNRNAYAFSGTLRLPKPAPFIAAGFDVIDGGSSSSDMQGVIVFTDTATSDTWTYLVPAGRLLVAVYVVSDSDQTVQLGTSAGGDQLGGPLDLIADQYGLLGDNNLRTVAATSIYLSGLEGNNTIEVWTLKKT